MAVQRTSELNHEGVFKTHCYWKEAQANHEQDEQAITSASTIQIPRDVQKELGEIGKIFECLLDLQQTIGLFIPQLKIEDPPQQNVLVDFTSEPFPMLESFSQAWRLCNKMDLIFIVSISLELYTNVEVF